MEVESNSVPLFVNYGVHQEPKAPITCKVQPTITVVNHFKITFTAWHLIWYFLISSKFLNAVLSTLWKSTGFALKST